jgi:hypothetical protein
MPRLLMNCDQVFDVLTRGPFPTGAASDAAVERHLRACHECRELAEALQPAVELLHEAISPDEASGLPEYSGALSASEGNVATAEAWRPTPLSVRKLARQEVLSRRPSRWLGLARFSAAAVLLFAVGSLAYGVLTTARQPGGPFQTKSPARLDERGLVTLAALQLPAGCFPRDLLESTGQRDISPIINQAALVCCTECHNAQNPQRPMVGSVAVMHHSCLACHHSL